MITTAAGFFKMLKGLVLLNRKILSWLTDIVTYLFIPEGFGMIDVCLCSSVLLFQYISINVLYKLSSHKVLLSVQLNLICGLFRNEAGDSIINPLGKSSTIDYHHFV